MLLSAVYVGLLPTKILNYANYNNYDNTMISYNILYYTILLYISVASGAYKLCIWRTPIPKVDRFFFCGN